MIGIDWNISDLPKPVGALKYISFPLKNFIRAVRWPFKIFSIWNRYFMYSIPSLKRLSFETRFFPPVNLNAAISKTCTTERLRSEAKKFLPNEVNPVINQSDQPPNFWGGDVMVLNISTRLIRDLRRLWSGGTTTPEAARRLFITTKEILCHCLTIS